MKKYADIGFDALRRSNGGGRSAHYWVRGSVLTIDAGAEGGLIKGLSVDIVRPPGEAIIHPITGENLGAPELVIGRGEISKTSNRAANVQVEPGLLLSVRPGDIARFTTPQEEMLMDQERSVVTQEKNQEAHQGFRNEISRLTRSIKSVQGRIGGLEQMMKRVERVEEGFRVQLQGINSDMNVMKEDIADLKEAVSLMGAVPIAGLDEEGVQEPVDLSSAESVGQIRQIVQDVLDESQIGMAPLESEDLALPDETSLDTASDGKRVKRPRTKNVIRRRGFFSCSASWVFCSLQPTSTCALWEAVTKTKS